MFSRQPVSPAARSPLFTPMLFRLPPLRAGLGLLAVLSFSTASLPAASAPAPIALGAAGSASVYPFLPPAAKATGGAVLIVPSAAYTGKESASEGAQLAKFLNDRGLAAFVLGTKAAADSDAAVAEVQRALRMLRAKAAEYKIAPQRIAVLGFASGAELAAKAAYESPAEAKPDATDALEKLSGQPDLLALVWGARAPEKVAANAPATFIVGSTNSGDGMTATIDLWGKLRTARVSVDAHFFPKADAKAGLAANNELLGTWPELFYNWARFSGLMNEGTRVPIKGMVYLDGRVLPHGYVILTPVDFVGTGPVIARVFNSTASDPIGQFEVPAAQGPIAGRYKVDVRQNMNRWLSNSFSGGLVSARGGQPTPEMLHFGHHRALAPSIGDQMSFTKVRPADRSDYIIEIKPDAAANQALKIEVFSK